MTDLVEEVARALAAYHGYDPNETWEEYDRNAGATMACMGNYPGWEDDVFPKTIRWHEYEGQARAAIAVVIERCAKVAESVQSYDDALQKSAGCLTSGQRIAAAIRKLGESE